MSCSHFRSYGASPTKYGSVGLSRDYSRPNTTRCCSYIQHNDIIVPLLSILPFEFEHIVSDNWHDWDVSGKPQSQQHEPILLTNRSCA